MISHAPIPPAPCNWLMFLLLLLSSAAADAPSEGCYERIAIGRRIKASDVITTLPTSSLSRCREACDKHPSNQCNSFGFGIGRKLNGTCELSSASIPTDPIPPFIRIESTSTVKLHSSKTGTATSPSNETSEAPSSAAPSASSPTDLPTDNSTTSVSTPTTTNGNTTETTKDSKGTPSEEDNETAPPLATVADVDFDVYAKRPSSLCQRSPGAIDPWILRPLPSTPASPPVSTPSSPPPSRPPSPSAPPPHPHKNHHNNHHHHGPGPHDPTGFRRPVPANRLQPPPLFQTPAMQSPPYPFRPQPSPPSASFMPPYNDGSFGPPPSQQGGFQPPPQQPPFPAHPHNHYPGSPVHNDIPHGAPPNGGFSHNGIPFGGAPPNGASNGGAPYGGVPPNGLPHGGVPHGLPHGGGIPNGGAPHHGGSPNGGVGIPNGGEHHHGGSPNGGVGIPSGGAPHHGGAPNGGVGHGAPPIGGGGAPFGGPPFASLPNGGGTHGAAPPGGVPNQPLPPHGGGGPQQPGSQHANGDPPNFGDGANMIPHVPCFHRVTTGRVITESLSHRTMQAPNLDDCRRLCTIEHHFRCEGFLYRWDTRLCALTAAPLSEIRFQEHAHAPSAEYFARTAIGHGICPPREGAGGSHGVRGPQGPAGWPPRDLGDGGTLSGRPFGGSSIGSASWGSSGGGGRSPQRGGSNGQQLPGFYGAPSAEGSSGGGWAQQPEQTGPPDHRFDVRGGGGGWGNRWRGGGGGSGGGNGGGGGRWSVVGGSDGSRVRGGQRPPAGPPPASSSFRPVDRPPSGPSGPWSASGGGSGGGWTKGHGDEDDECFVLVRRGFRLTPDGRPHPPPSDHEDAHAGDLVFMSVRVRSRDPEDCAKECYRSAMFHCDAFSYRFNGDPRTQGLSNCDLSGQPLKKLDPYKDLVQDRDYDVYGRTSGRACGDGAIMVGHQSNGGHIKRPFPPRRGSSDVHHPPPPPPPPPIARPPERPTKPSPPSYLDNSIGTGSGWSDSDNQHGGHKGQQDTTVGGRPCAPGSTCTRHPDGGFWGCPVSSFGLEKEMTSDSGRDWDYCCRPGHQCGYSEGYHLPWCYVGSADRDQWRPCSQEHYPPPSGTLSVASSSSHKDNSTIGNGHHHHDNHQNSINQVAYLHSEKPKDNHTATHEQNDSHGITSLVSMPHSDLNKQQHNSDESDATIQKILDLLVSSGKEQDRLPVSEDNKVQTSIKSEEEENRSESRPGRGNRAYSRRTEEVRHFYPKYSHSRPKPRVHEIQDGYDESEETRIIQSNFTVVEDADE